MLTTEQITITLPIELANHMRERIASGSFTDSSDYIEHVMVEALLPAPQSDAELTQWMNTEGARRLEALHANPASGLNIDEAFDGLIDDDIQFKKDR